VEDSPSTRRFELTARGSHPVPRGGERVSRLVNAVVFVTTAGFLLAYALPGGAYDIVVRQEYGIVLWAVIGTGFALGLLPRARPRLERPRSRSHPTRRGAGACTGGDARGVSLVLASLSGRGRRCRGRGDCTQSQPSDRSRACRGGCGRVRNRNPRGPGRARN